MRALAAEFVGTFLLVFVGCGAIVANENGAVGLVGVALAFGGTVAVAVYVLGRVSGAHINPAVTLAFAATGRFPWRRVPFYVAVQIAGALAAAYALFAIHGPAANVGVTALDPGLSAAAGFAIEFVATFILGVAIWGAAVDSRAPQAASGAVIGLAIAIDVLFAGPLTGASMNPARTIGPAVVAGYVENWWVYVAGPIAGAIAGAGAYERLVTPRRGRTTA